jgi:hypothetical protein
MYLCESPGSAPQPRGIMVFTLAGDRVCELSRFDVDVLASFGLAA